VKRQWFRGELDGHYAGHPQSAGSSGRVLGGDHFRIEVTRAVVAELELSELCAAEEVPEHLGFDAGLGDEEGGADLPGSRPVAERPSYHHQAEGEVLHQQAVPHAFFLHAMGEGRTVRGAAHDVLMSEVRLSHASRMNGKAYGRIRAKVSGWYEPLPAPAEPSRVEPPERRGEVWRTEVLVSEMKSDSSSPDALRSRGELKARLAIDGGTDSELENGEKIVGTDIGPVAVDENLVAAPDFPFFIAGAILALLLFVFAGGVAAAAWGSFYLTALVLRRWLRGVVPEGWFVRGLALALMGAQVLAVAIVLGSWEQDGCKSLSALALIFLGGSLFVSGLLPRWTSFAVAAVAFAVFLGQYFGPYGPICS